MEQLLEAEFQRMLGSYTRTLLAKTLIFATDFWYLHNCF